MSSAAKMPFPVQLYDMLTDAETNHFSHIISWLPSGTAFKIHRLKEFKEYVLPRYFKGQTRYKSFSRQLNLYKFKFLKASDCITTSQKENAGGYVHSRFCRWDRDQCFQISRSKRKKALRYPQQLATPPTRNSEECCPLKNIHVNNDDPVTSSCNSLQQLRNEWYHNSSNNVPAKIHASSGELHPRHDQEVKNVASITRRDNNVTPPPHGLWNMLTPESIASPVNTEVQEQSDFDFFFGFEESEGDYYNKENYQGETTASMMLETPISKLDYSAAGGMGTAIIDGQHQQKHLLEEFGTEHEGVSSLSVDPNLQEGNSPDKWYHDHNARLLEYAHNVVSCNIFDTKETSNILPES